MCILLTYGAGVAGGHRHSLHARAAGCGIAGLWLGSERGDAKVLQAGQLWQRQCLWQTQCLRPGGAEAWGLAVGAAGESGHWHLGMGRWGGAANLGSPEHARGSIQHTLGACTLILPVKEHRRGCSDCLLCLPRAPRPACLTCLSYLPGRQRRPSCMWHLAQAECLG